MTPEAAADLAKGAVIMTLMVASPMLIAGLVVGVFVSILQAVTQIQEMTLTFIPKIVAIMLIIIVLGRWMASQMVIYTHRIFVSVQDLIGR